MAVGHTLMNASETEKPQEDWWGDLEPAPNDDDMDAMNGDFDTTDR